MIVRLVCIFCFWIVSFAVQAADFRVTFINPGDHRGFWGEVTRTMAAAASDLNVDLEVLHAGRQPYEMEALLARRLAEGDLPDYFILVNENQSAARLMQLMDGHGSKVLFLLNNLTPKQKTELTRRNIDVEKVIASIVPDNETAGFDMAESLIETSRLLQPDKDELRLLALTGDSATPAALQRELGMMRAVAAHPHVTLLHSIPVNWSEDEAYRHTKAVLSRTTVDVVWGANDDLAIGAQRAAEEAGLVAGKDIFFAGLNWSKRGMEAVKTSGMTMSHGGHFFAGAWSVVMLRDHYFRDAQGEIFVDVLFKMSPITPENVEMYMQRLGDGDWNKIDFRQFCKSRTGNSNYDFSAEAILEAAGS
ncbi:ABC transporter substrate-binding protein [Roseibium sp.]|uniref:ABC transporter substrate-binding protein n=1 Tax=Roseibium sp. TaxID=1936156 RepID=UPI003BAE91B9